MQHTVIGVSGRLGSGKDTAYGFIQEWMGLRGVSTGRRGFADSLKHSFARLFIPDISVDEAVIWCNEIKFTGTLDIFWSNAEDAAGTTTEVKHTISGRTALQRYGTEAHRDVFGDTFWIDVLLPSGMILIDGVPTAPLYAYNFVGQFEQEPPIVSIVTDVRFDNEALRIKELDGTNLLITRPTDPSSRDEHVSEAGVMGELIDYVIVNDGTLEQFRDSVFAFCEEHFKELADGE